MKIVLVLTLAVIHQFIYAQHAIRFNNREFFTFSASIDLKGAMKEGEIDIVGEAEYAGFIGKLVWNLFLNCMAGIGMCMEHWELV